MARETQKAKIERLENELAQAKDLIQKLNNEIDNMIDKADNSFENSVIYKQMKKQITDLELKLKVTNDSVEHNKTMYQYELKKNDELINEIQQLKNENKVTQKVHNERGAGRKAKYNAQDIETMKMYRLQGKTYNEIATLFQCSIGLVHKLINEQ